MGAYIITNSELVAIANAIRNKNSSNETFTLEQIPNAIATIGENIGSGAVVRTATNDKYIINEAKLINIANAIRNRLGISNEITIANMPNLINSIDLNLIVDSWDTIIANIDNGTYATKYKVGQYKPLTISGKSVDMQIVAFDRDIDSKNNTIPITFISIGRVGVSKGYQNKPSIASYLDSGILKPFVDGFINKITNQSVVNRIIPALKTISLYNGEATELLQLWIPSARELGKTNNCESTGAVYNEVYPSNNNTARKKYYGTEELYYWTRSTTKSVAYDWYNVFPDGAINQGSAENYSSVVLGFCLGFEPTYTVNYYNGSTLLYSDTVKLGENSSYSGSTPTKTQDAQYTYTFAGWSNGTDDNTVDSNALNNITEDRDVYACFTSTLRTYTVTFVRASEDGGGTLQTLNNIVYGTVLTNSSYTGSTPTTTQGSGSDYAFLGWTPAFTAITGNTTYTAQFDNPIKEITDSWDTIIANIDNGTYSTKYKVGNYKPLDLSTEGTINMQIVGINEDNLSGGGKAPLTFIGMELLATGHRMNPENNNGTIGTGGNGGWENCEMRTYLKDTIKPLIPATVRNAIVDVTKIQSTVTNGSMVKDGQTTIEDVWIPSHYEVLGYMDYETTGPTYTEYFKDYTYRRKQHNGNFNKWWLRSTNSSTSFRAIHEGGAKDYFNSKSGWYVALGFCLGTLPKYTVNYYNGSTLLYSEDVSLGNNGSYVGSTPTKDSDVQYTYTFAGWSNGTDDNIVDNNALTNIVADRNVYACFTSALRKYTVTFIKASDDGGGTLQTISNVDYGTSIGAASSYTGSTPTTTKGNATDYPFLGWNPLSITVTGNTTFTARFGSPVEVAEISDTWDQIIQHIDVGDYKTRYKVGNYKAVDFGQTFGGNVEMQIACFDTDDLSNGSGKAPITFIARQCLNKSNSPTLGEIMWSGASLINYIPDNIKKRIVSINKTVGSNLVSCRVWRPVLVESTNTNSYTMLFRSNADRIRKTNTGDDAVWGFQKVGNNGYPYVNTDGTTGSSSNATQRNILPCFCLGLEPETITDDWATILANTNYATDYSIGDTKYLDLGTEGKHLMEIVAINEDDRADGNGKAGLTWISKDLLATTHRMNPNVNGSSTIGIGANGGWLNCEMRTYLKNTIKPLIPDIVRNAIVEVTKIQSNFNGSMIKDGQTSTEDVWIPSCHELSGVTAYETTGSVYTSKFVNAASRAKKRNGSNIVWWTRSARERSAFVDVYNDGSFDYSNSSSANGVALGFCTN